MGNRPFQNASPFPVRKNTTSLTKSTSRPAKSRKMSFAVGGNAVGFDTFVSPGVGARAVEYGASSYPVLHPRQNSTTPSDTINMFIESFQYAQTASCFDPRKLGKRWPARRGALRAPSAPTDIKWNMNSHQNLIFQLILCVMHGVSPPFRSSRGPVKRHRQ